MRFSPFKKKKLEVYKAKRFLFVQILFVSLGVVVLGRAVHLHVFEGDFLRGEGQKRFLRQESLSAYRGMILDRNGKTLAISTPTLSLWANPKQLIKAPESWPLVAKSVNMPFLQFQEQLLKYRNKEFMFLKRQMPPEICKKILALGVSGVYALPEYKRFYPSAQTVSHLVGFTGIDEKGQEGIELAYDEYLRGQGGKKLVVKDLLGHTVKDLGIRTPAVDGSDIWLSIDLRVQYRAYQALESAVTHHQAESASLVALDISSGEVLAIVNYPSFDPNDRSTLNDNVLRNRAITDLFEPGSTIKPFTVAAGLESGLYSGQTMIDTSPGYMRIGRKWIKDHRNYGEINLTSILTKSSNIGATKLAMSLPADTLPELFSRFGFGQILGSGFPGETIGYVPQREISRPIEIATLSYGYGMSTTLLHLAQAYATLGRYGVYKPVSLLSQKHQFSKNGSVNDQGEFSDIAIPGERVLDESISKQVMLMMETVVSAEGTAEKASVKGYRIAGKTGTTHKLINGSYAENKYMSLFGGVAPVSKPRWAVAVIVDDPKSKAYYGGDVAAPVFAEVVNTLFRLYGVVPDKTLYKLSNAH